MRSKVSRGSCTVHRRGNQLSILHIHTELLEEMGWDEEAVDEAMSRSIEIARELGVDEESGMSAYEFKKLLMLEYSERISSLLCSLFIATELFKKELEKLDEEE